MTQKPHITSAKFSYSSTDFKNWKVLSDLNRKKKKVFEIFIKTIDLSNYIIYNTNEKIKGGKLKWMKK